MSKFILPPPQLQAVIDKTASFIAKNGMAFQQRIMEAEQSTKFSFLVQDDPYHSYFTYTLDLIKKGQLPESLIKENTIEEEEIVPEKPEPLIFLTDIGSINRMDLDLIKLTANYTSKYGQSFHLQLMQKEKNNFRFHFLKPTHSKHQLYQDYVVQFKYINENYSNLTELVGELNKNPLSLLPKIISRTEYLQYEQSISKNESSKQDALRDLYDSIDWHEYELVESIFFGEADKNEEFPPPLSLDQLKTMSILEKQQKLKDLQVKMDTIEAELQEEVIEEDLSMEMDISEDDLPDTNLNVKQPLRKQENEKIILVNCPNCSKKFKDTELQKHLKACLYDKTHLEQLQRHQMKATLTTSAPDELVAQNIQNRYDIVENKAEVIWDGKQHTKQKALDQSKKRKHEEIQPELQKEEFDISIQLPVHTGQYKDICKGQTLIITLIQSQSIIDIKKQIDDKIKLPWNKIKLFKDNVMLKNASKVKDLQENDIITVKL